MVVRLIFHLYVPGTKYPLRHCRQTNRQKKILQGIDLLPCRLRELSVQAASSFTYANIWGVILIFLMRSWHCRLQRRPIHFHNPYVCFTNKCYILSHTKMDYIFGWEKQLYKRLCPSICPSVGLSVHLPVPSSVMRFLQNGKFN